MNIVYLITDTQTNLKYIGSKRNYQGIGTYFGSPSAGERHPKYDNQQIWKSRSNAYPEDFNLEILYETNDDTIDILSIERKFQVLHDVISNDMFINACFANKGFCNINGTRHGDILSDTTKRNISKGLYEHYGNLTDEQRKEISSRQIISQRKRWDSATEEDHRIKSEIQKTAYDNMSDEMKSHKAKKCSDSLKIMYANKTPEEKELYRLIHQNSQKKIAVIINGVTYDGLKIAARALGIGHGTVKRRCQSIKEKFNTWTFA